MLSDVIGSAFISYYQIIKHLKTYIMVTLTTKLTVEEQNDIIGTLFGLQLIDVNKNDKDHWFVLYDEEGDEFYGSNGNCQFDLSTLAGIFSYSAHIYKEKGASDKQYEIRKALGL